MITNYEIEGTMATNRFLTSNRHKAFELRKKLEVQSNDTSRHWMVGKAILDRVVIEIDTHDKENLRTIWAFYSKLYHNSFGIIKTMHGYHLVQKHQVSKELLQYSRCLVLCPFLSINQLPEYESMIEQFFNTLKEERENKEFTQKELQERSKEIPKRLKDANLDYSKGTIDVLHALIGIQKKKYVLRISKKTKDDKMELIQ